MKFEISPGTSLLLAKRLVPNLIGSRDEERAIEVDQSNHSVVVNERIIVKWLRQPMPIPHQSVTKLLHLREVGFDQVPKLCAVHQEDGFVLATIGEFIPNSKDGWEWYVDDLTSELEVASSFARTASQIGGLVARLHIALATKSSIVPEPISLQKINKEVDRWHDTYEMALHSAQGETLAMLMSFESSIRAALDGDNIRGEFVTMPIHADLHIGQILRAGNKLFINDFDGDPISKGLEFRRPAVVDVASLLQSIDHVGRVVAKRHPSDKKKIEQIVDQAIGSALGAYLLVLSDNKMSHIFEERLLHALRVTQELHEIVYSARLLPRWMYVPTAALPHLLGAK